MGANYLNYFYNYFCGIQKVVPVTSGSTHLKIVYRQAPDFQLSKRNQTVWMMKSIVG